ncbi:HDOD domain-containing protein [Candidatus Nitrotoga sp. HW29]|uniref:HDOD domain-containing protein n=1 Tax=Candidatus Nitrotoga sp. HW29 TaxID=2886963 RepID=UPI001EF19A2E|nr:HDOD domain-containing protein [Candidatus Nitrotoga sp. HW29]
MRIDTLRSCNMLDTPPEECFDRITRLAQHLFNVPIALVSLVDTDRQWFKSRMGLSVSETPRNISFSGHAILGDGIFIVPDTLLDKRFYDNPLVTGDPSIRFYAGCPLAVSNGSKLGTLCLIDSRPRMLNNEERKLLQELACMVEQEITKVQTVTKNSTTIPDHPTSEKLAQRALNVHQHIKNPTPLQPKESSISQGLCTSCAYVGKMKTVIKGNVKTGIILWFCFLIPGLIYSIWRSRSRHEVCPICNGVTIIPADSPQAKQIIRENQTAKTLVTSHDSKQPSKPAIEVNKAVEITTQTNSTPTPPGSQHIEIRQTVKNIDALPAMPVIAQKLLALQINSDESEREMLMLIEQDPQISAKIIGLSNSAKLGSARKPTSVKEAAILLGMSRVKSIATGIAIMSLSSTVSTDKFKAQDLWLHSFGIAFAMLGITRAMPAKIRPNDDQVFLAGILHDIGYLALAFLNPKQSDDLHARLSAEPDRPVLSIEREMLEICHDELGAELARHWSLPDEIITILRYHHTPNVAEAAAGRPIVHMINLAEKLLASFGINEHVDTQISDEDWEVLGIDPSKAEEIGVEVAEQAEQAAAVY